MIATAIDNRADGVFDEGFPDYLDDQIKAAPDADVRCENRFLGQSICKFNLLHIDW